MELSPNYIFCAIKIKKARDEAERVQLLTTVENLSSLSLYSTRVTTVVSLCKRVI